MSELTSLTDIALIPCEFKWLTWPFTRLISGERTSTSLFFSRVDSTDTRIHNRQSLKYNRLSRSSWKIYKNFALRFKNKPQGFLLMLIAATKPENFAHFPELNLRHFQHAFARAPHTISVCYLFRYAG